jgi:hypothetical protein
MPSLINRIRWWWMFRDVKGMDPDLTASGDRVTIDIGTPAWFKRCLSIQLSPEDLRLLHDMLSDHLAETGHVSGDCAADWHRRCQAERDRTRKDGHGDCCRQDNNRCTCGCHRQDLLDEMTADSIDAGTYDKPAEWFEAGD